MKSFLIFILLIHIIHSYNLCDVQENLFCNKTQTFIPNLCNVKTTTTIRSRDCSQIGFDSNENLKYNFGDIVLHLEPFNSTTQLSMDISLADVKWKKAYLRLSDYIDPNICKLFTVGKHEKIYIKELYYNCIWHNAKYRESKSYVMEFKAKSNVYFVHRKILYDIPDFAYFGDSVHISKRLIFSYIDFTNLYKIVLKIQPLHEYYNITHYKVEVFRQRGNRGHMLDVRFIPAKRAPVLNFEHLTYSEEGFHYFAVSVISDQCPEDACAKTFTAKLYISRRGTPLVVGIVGASLLIPFILFSFYIWNCRYKYQGGLTEAVEKVLILFKPSFDKHNEVVITLAKTIKHLTGIEVMMDPINTSEKQKGNEKWCSDNLLVATYIIYVNPPFVDDNIHEMDYMIYSFLKEESKKSVSQKKILVVNFPYSNKDVPPLLANFPKFELIDDFPGFINIFQLSLLNFNYKNDINFMELLEKIKQAQMETEHYTIMPKITITEQVDNLEESAEIDVLL